MTKSKKQNPIEEAIGARAKKPKTPETPSLLRDAPEQPLTLNEAANLESLNQATEERLQDQYPEEEIPAAKIVTPKSEILVSKPDPQPVTKTSSPESPPQGIETDNHKEHVVAFNKTAKEFGFHPQITSVEEAAKQIQETKIAEIDEYADAEKKLTLAEMVGKKMAQTITPPAEDIHLTALRDYIMGTGFVASGVAFHIVALCSQPMTTPTTTTWDFKDRASIPDMVFALLKQSGYIEGIWPSLKVVMADNKGNAAWTAGIATTMAFFDVIRTLPAIKELQNVAKETT